jgi:hypothetical protein
MGMKVAIVGLSDSTHDQAPWSDPEWQIWGLPWDHKWPYMDRLFEMHDLRLLVSEHSKRPRDYFHRLSMAGVPVYMQGAYFDWATEYPMEIARYYNSSIAYAMALAIHEGAEEIAIYGVDMDDEQEYAYQRPNMEYLIGLAEGKGIKVYIPPESSLCTFNHKGIKFYDHFPEYKDRYGWLG